MLIFKPFWTPLGLQMGPWSDQWRPGGSQKAGSKVEGGGLFLNQSWNPLWKESFGTSGHPKVPQGTHFDRFGTPLGDLWLDFRRNFGLKYPRVLTFMLI